MASLSRNEIPGKQHLHGLFAQQVAAQRHGRGRAEQADVDARDGKSRVFGRHGQVAVRDQLAAGCRGNAVDAGDDGLRQPMDTHHHAPATVEQRLVHGAVFAGPHFLQIMARAKRLALGGNNHDSHRFILGDLIQLALQADQQIFGQCIVLCRAIQRQCGNAVDIAAQQQGRWVDCVGARAHRFGLLWHFLKQVETCSVGVFQEPSS